MKDRHDRRTVLKEIIKVGALADLRRHILRLALGARLVRSRAEDFALAVIEAATNVIRHGGGVGTLTVVQDDQSRLIAQVRDSGPGIPPGVAICLPPAQATGGRGLWMARALTDRMQVRSGSAGTTVGLEMTLDHGKGA